MSKTISEAGVVFGEAWRAFCSAINDAVRFDAFVARLSKALSGQPSKVWNFGDYTVSRYDDRSIWIEAESGEGMQISVDEIFKELF